MVVSCPAGIEFFKKLVPGPLAWPLLLAVLPLMELPAQQTPEHRQAAGRLDQGRRYLDGGEISQARDLFRRALSFFEETDDCYFTACTYYWLSEADYSLGELEQALESAGKALAAADRCPGRDTMPVYSMILQNLGVFHSAVGEFDEQLAFYQAAYDHIMKLQGRESERGADAYFNLSAAFGRRGDWERSIRYLDTSLQIARRLDYQAGIASAYLNLAYAYGEKKDYVRAIDYQRMALRLTNDQGELARGYNNLGVLYSDLGDTDLALRYLEQALDLRRQTGQRGGPGELSTLLNITRVHFEAGNQALADARLDEILEDISRAGLHDGNRPYYKVALHYKAVMALRNGQEKEAEDYAERAMALDGGQLRMEGSTRLVLANVLLARGRYDRALEYVQDGLKEEVPGFRPRAMEDNPPLRLIQSPGVALDLLALKASLYYHLGRRKGSENDLSTSLNIYLLADSLVTFFRKTYQDNTSKELLAANARNIYAGAIAAGHEIFRLSGDDAYLDLVFTYSEKNKSLLVLEKMHDLYASSFYGLPRRLMERERQLLQEIEYYSNQLAFYRGRRPPAVIGAWEDSLFYRRWEQEALLHQLDRDYPEYYALKHDLTSVTPDEIQDGLLREGEVLIEYFLAPASLYIFVIGKDRRDLVEVPLERDIRDLVGRFREALIYQKDEFFTLSHALYRLLIAPVERSLTGKELIIVPDGVLGYVPFEVLLAEEVPAASRNRHRSLPYLLRRYPLRYSFSAGLALTGRAVPFGENAGEVLGLAPDFEGAPIAGADTSEEFRMIRDQLSALPGGRIEMKLLAGRFRGDFRVGPRATESRLKELDSRYKLLHITTHTLVDDRFPSLSKLAFAEEPAGGEDGFLNAYELYGLRLPLELIVLSACNTGVGPLREGEGIASLARAFAFAGCPNLVMSLWPVKDQTTAEIMGYFYDNIADGMSKGRALQEAKRKYLDEGNELLSHPFFWGTFIYVGDQEPIRLRKREWWSFASPEIALPAGALLLLAAGLAWRKRRKPKNRKTE